MADKCANKQTTGDACGHPADLHQSGGNCWAATDPEVDHSKGEGLCLCPRYVPPGASPAEKREARAESVGEKK